MSISEKLKKRYKNQVKTIKNMKNSKEKDLLIGSLVADLGKRSINAVAKELGYSWRKVKKEYTLFISDDQNINVTETRGKKK